MRGHVRKAKDRNGNLLKDTWDIVVELPRDPANPKKRRQQWKRIQGTKKEAEMFLADWLHKIRHEPAVVEAHSCFENRLRDWLTIVENSVKFTTFSDYQNIVRKHLIPALGQFKLCDINEKVIARYYKEKLDEGISPVTVGKHHRVLHNIFGKLFESRRIRYNPVDLLSPPIVEEEYEAQVLEHDQIIDVIALAKIYFPKIYLIVLLALSTGMRRGEIAGLRWNCVYLDTGIIEVRWQYQRTRNGLAFTKVKTKGSKRSFKLPQFVVEELTTVKQQQEQNKKLLGNQYSNNNLVCCWPDGKPFNPDWISRNWNLFAKKIGIELRLHDTRHSHVTLLTELRVSDKEIQDRVGHVTDVMKNRYTHTTKRMNDQVASLIEESIFERVAERISDLTTKKSSPVFQTCLNMFERCDKS